MLKTKALKTTRLSVGEVLLNSCQVIAIYMVTAFLENEM